MKIIILKKKGTEKEKFGEAVNSIILSNQQIPGQRGRAIRIMSGKTR